MGELEEMEMELLVKGGREVEWLKKWKEMGLKWDKGVGLGDDEYGYDEDEKVGEYGNGGSDIELVMGLGLKEVEGME